MMNNRPATSGCLDDLANVDIPEVRGERQTLALVPNNGQVNRGIGDRSMSPVASPPVASPPSRENCASPLLAGSGNFTNGSTSKMESRKERIAIAMITELKEQVRQLQEDVGSFVNDTSHYMHQDIRLLSTNMKMLMEQLAVLNQKQDMSYTKLARKMQLLGGKTLEMAEKLDTGEPISPGLPKVPFTPDVGAKNMDIGSANRASPTPGDPPLGWGVASLGEAGRPQLPQSGLERALTAQSGGTLSFPLTLASENTNDLGAIANPAPVYDSNDVHTFLRSPTISIGASPSIKRAKRQQEMTATASLNTAASGAVAVFGPSRGLVGDNLEDTLAEAIAEVDVAQVVQFLKDGEDPNEVLEDIQYNEKPYLTCSMIALAAMSKEEEIVRALHFYNADLNGGYSFVAGTLKIVWEGSAMHACIPRGNLSMLKTLHELKADIRCSSSNEANLIWQACYFGKPAILEYLFKNNVNFLTEAQSQDISGVTYAPLHIAARNGHEACVLKLCAAKADIDSPNQLNLSPLQDAIIQCKAPCVRALVTEGANLMNAKPFTEQDKATLRRASIRAINSESSEYARTHGLAWECDEEAMRVLDLVFKLGNPVVISAVAEGLRHQEDQMMQLGPKEMVRFLATPGSAGHHIIRALFKKRDIVFFQKDEKGGNPVRTHIITAHIGKAQILPNGQRHDPINVAVLHGGYHQIHAKFRERTPLSEKEGEFLFRLAPQTEASSRGSDTMMVTVQLFEGLVRGIHMDLRIVKAVSRLEQDLFESKSCQAVIQFCWNRCRVQAKFEVFLHTLLMFIFLGLAITLRPPNPPEQETPVKGLAFLGGIVNFIMVGLEFLQIASLARRGWMADYLSNKETSVDWLRICADGMVLLYLLKEGLNAMDSKIFLCVFALCSFWKWIAILYALTPFRVFGLSILPILHTMLDVGPFLTVLAFHMFGLMHGYIALSIPDIDMWEGGLLVYQLGLLGDASPDDLDGGNERYWGAVRIFYCGVAFIVTITLMNTFIAALGNSFTIASGKMEILYQYHLSDRLLTFMAVRETAEKITSSDYKKKEERHKESSLWYCTAEKLQEVGTGKENWLGF
jgi:hypothetical protein